ncbi:hypothetical protein Ancab_016317 [Ancistrocladus abbreviatus]
MEIQAEGKENINPAAKHTSMNSLPSASSSPSHEFSFTISLHSSITPVDKMKVQPPSAIDLSPADDIFFHGHLLPLHLLSNLPTSPRTSTNSLDSFTLPITDFLEEEKSSKNNSCNFDLGRKENSSHSCNTKSQNESCSRGSRSKSKSFSLLGLKGWRRKGSEAKEEGEEEREKQRRKLRKFDVSHFLTRMVKPFLFLKGRRENHIQFHRQPYSFSGNLSPRGRRDLRGRRGEFSAPASMRTSPTNSGLLLAKAGLPPPTSDSTMEELQAAIQAAIAHCKNSIASEEMFMS